MEKEDYQRAVEEANKAAKAQNLVGSEFHNSPANVIRHLGVLVKSGRASTFSKIRRIRALEAQIIHMGGLPTR